MATLPQDMIRFEFESGDFKDAWLKDTNLQWPPPEKIMWKGFVWKRIRYSPLTDEQASSPYLSRGALYRADMDFGADESLGDIPDFEFIGAWSN